jgi:SOS response regulatory protein OraA/RecX
LGFADAIRSAFSFLAQRSQTEERIAQYVIREHRRGRALAEILDDLYVTNRLSREQIHRLLERPEVIHELGEDLVAQAHERV